VTVVTRRRTSNTLILASRTSRSIMRSSYATSARCSSIRRTRTSVLEPDLATEVRTLATTVGIQPERQGRSPFHIEAERQFSPPVNRVRHHGRRRIRDRARRQPERRERLFRPVLRRTSSAPRPAKGGPIAGIKTPNATTGVVFHLSKADGRTCWSARSPLPLSSPVPKEVAGPLE